MTGIADRPLSFGNVLPRALARVRALRQGFATRQLKAKLAFPSGMDRWRKEVGPQGEQTAQYKAGEDHPLVDVYGFMRGSLGLGQAARLYVRALALAAMPMRIFDVSLGDGGLTCETTEQDMAGDAHAAAHRFNLVFVNPDHFHELSSVLSFQQGEMRPYTIAVWFWELPTIPEQWLKALAYVDEVWVASSFVRTAFSRVGDKPIVLIPPPVAPVDSGMAWRDRASIGVPEDAYVFLFVFDFNSVYARKNPGAIIEAFKAAFPQGDEDVRLIIKTSNGLNHLGDLRDLMRRAESDSRVMVRDQRLGATQMAVLHASSDAYVSLHRSEGFGLTIAESMARGKPVIATNWSGNVDFMDAENSLPIDYELVPVAEGQYPGDVREQWAEPDVRHAARAMRRLAEDRQLGSRLGARARSRLESDYNFERVGKLMADRLATLAASP